MKRKPRLVLHIGTEKTGTTSIQHLLSGNRRELGRYKVLYPESPGLLAHGALTAYALDDHRRDDLRAARKLCSDSDLRRFRAVFQSRLAAECGRRGVETVVLSDEHCHSRLIERSEVERLRGLLVPLFSEIRVVVYLRRQDELASSAYASSLKFGGVVPSIDQFFAEIDASDQYYNFLQLYQRWTSVFGESAMTVRVYDRDRFVGGDLLEDFLEASGLGFVGGLDRPRPRNVAISYEACEFLRLFNRSSPNLQDGEVDRRRAHLIEIIEQRHHGKAHLPSLGVARDLLGRFEESNARLESALGCSPLFGSDFSKYPERAEQRPLTAEQATSIAAEIWKGMGELERARGSSLSRLLSALRRPRSAYLQLRRVLGEV